MTNFDKICGYLLDETLSKYIGISANHKCTLCKKNVPQVYVYKRAEVTYFLCELCNLVYRYDNDRLKYGILCVSSMEQNDIVTKTHEYFAKYRQIPNIVNVDKEAKFIDVSTPDLICVLSSDTTRDKFYDIKLFFTDKNKLSTLQNIKFGINGVPKIRRYQDYGFFVENVLEKVSLSPEQIDIIKNATN